jgi:hypothetical protein
MNNELWSQIIREGKKNQSNPEQNVLSPDDVNIVLGTMDFFSASHGWLGLTLFDLNTAKYKVFDWLGMCIMGRNDEDRKNNNTALQVLVHAFITADYKEEKFIENLRTIDYQVVTDWQEINIEGETTNA